MTLHSLTWPQARVSPDSPKVEVGRTAFPHQPPFLKYPCDLHLAVGPEDVAPPDPEDVVVVGKRVARKRKEIVKA